MTIRKPKACKRKKPHISPPDLICDPSLAPDMCGEAQRSALLAMSAATTAIAAAGLADAPAAPAEDRLLTVAEAALRLSVSEDRLYRWKDAPFRVEVATGTIRFSAAGIATWIAAKAAGSAA